MRSTFFAYYPLPDAVRHQLWRDALIVVDASVLLNPYRYSDDAREELFKTLERHDAQLWLPHQAGLEYQKNRVGVIQAEAALCGDFVDETEKLISRLSNPRNHPFVSRPTFDAIRASLDQAATELGTKRVQLKSLLRNDIIRDRLSALTDNRIGQPLGRAELERITKDGPTRYVNKVPPGYKDDKKPVTEKFGDLIFWFQILAQAKLTTRSVILVTDDAKEDWWLKSNGMKLSPRPELIEEFRTEAGGHLLLYNVLEFMQESGSLAGTPVSEDAADEIRAVTRALALSPDKTLTCHDCRSTFTFSSRDQEFFAERGFSEPKRCRSCAKKRPSELRREFVGDCARCGESTKFPFQPRVDEKTGKPLKRLYCRACFAEANRQPPSEPA